MRFFGRSGFARSKETVSWDGRTLLVAPVFTCFGGQISAPDERPKPASALLGVGSTWLHGFTGPHNPCFYNPKVRFWSLSI